jgi:hypothetical protein
VTAPLPDQPDDAAVQALRSLSVPDDLAARHLARLAAAPAGTIVPLRPRRTALRAGAAGVVVGVTLISGAGVAAASTARPGDMLYGLKTARERLQLSMARHGDSRARFELRLARTRLGEAAELFRHGHSDRAVETLARADAALASARAQGGAAVDADVDSELDRRVEVLGGLLDGGLPDTAADAAREAIERAVDRGAHPAKPVHPEHPTPGDTHPTPGPEDHPTPAPAPTTRPTPDHPGPSDHPTGRPTAVPSHH